MDWLGIKEFIKDAFKYIIIIVVILIVAIYVVGLQQVVGPSMSPTLKNNDILILDKISYRFKNIKRGDIVSIYYADTKYLINLDNIETLDFSIKEIGYDKIPEDMYLVLGDNRGDSLDSRDPNVGLIKRQDIIGKVRFRLWPLNKIKIVK